jgi:hypothetical protein
MVVNWLNVDEAKTDPTPKNIESIVNTGKDTGLEIYSQTFEDHPESKDHLPTALKQVNEVHHFKVNGLQ